MLSLAFLATLCFSQNGSDPWPKSDFLEPAELAKARMVALEPLKAQAEADRAAGVKPRPSWV